MTFPFAILAWYAIGCVSTGYLLTRWLTGKDIRQEGSGSTGARNVSRVLGAKGFALTFAGDMLKGLLAMLLAHALEFSGWHLMALVWATLLGHIFPAQLRFKGGKGLAVGFGMVAFINPWLALSVVALLGTLYLLSRKYELSSFLTIVLFPGLVYLWGHDATTLAGLSVMVAIVLAAHASNIVQFFQKKKTSP